MSEKDIEEVLVEINEEIGIALKAGIGRGKMLKMLLTWQILGLKKFVNAIMKCGLGLLKRNIRKFIF